MLFILVALAIGLWGMVPQASAVPLVPYVDNQLFFNNFESVFAGGSHPGIDPGTYLPLVEPLPLIIPRQPGPDGMLGTADDIAGDHFMGIINIQNIDAAGLPIWMAGGGLAPPDQLTGVFAQEVWAVHWPDPFDPTGMQTLPHVVLGAPSITAFTDPGGNTVDISAHLSGNEIIALYEETGGSWFESNGDMNDDINKATDTVGGSLWGTLGYGPGPDGIYGTADDPGFFYSHVSLGAPLVNFTGETWAQLDFIQDPGPGWNGLNDPSEHEMDLFLGMLFNDIYFSGELEPNPNSVHMDVDPVTPGVQPGTSPWDIASNDPAHLNPVPEPGTMLLLGTGLIGLGAFARRKLKKVS